MRKPVYGVPGDKLEIEISLVASLDMILSNKRNNKGADHTAQMRRLVCVFVVLKLQRQVFLGRGPFDIAHTVESVFGLV